MAAKKLTPDQQEDIESQVIPALQNIKSDNYEVEGYVFTFRRVKLIEKYKARVWSNKAITDIGLDSAFVYPEDSENANITFFMRLLGNLNNNVHSIQYPDKTYQTLNTNEYTFMLEEFLTTEIGRKGWDEEEFVGKVLDKYIAWSNQTPSEDDIKNS